MFQTLPPELINAIFNQVYIEDILALRTTCSIFAAVGLDHFGDEVPLVFHRDKFKALTEIAEHPKLSKQMRSLFYVGDRCKLQSYEQWDKHRPDPHPREETSYDRNAKFYTERDYRVCRREGMKKARKFMERRAAVPESDRRAAWETYRTLCKDIADVEVEGYDLHCLRVLFENCPGIREVTIGSQMDIARHLSANRTAFASATTSPYNDSDWWDTGVHQTLSVAMAAQQAGTKLDSLTLAQVSPTLFDPRSWEEEGLDEWPALKALVQPLRRLRLWIHAQPPEKSEVDFDASAPDIFSVHEQSDLAFQEGHLHEILSSASDLRVLKLGLPRWSENEEEAIEYYGDEDEQRFSRLELALRNITYPKLYELSLSDCEVAADYLVELCLRHKATLRRLYLSDISLNDLDDDWRDVFTRLSGQLPQLRRIKLRGNFYIDVQCEIRFEHAGLESRRIAPYRDALENFVLKGGEFPTNDINILPDQANYPDESYRRPGLPEDNTEPDDPELDYDSDEFSIRI